ncbi:hypothetical protein ACSSS7_007897 [Eimeria intestinalis]
MSQAFDNWKRLMLSNTNDRGLCSSQLSEPAALARRQQLQQAERSPQSATMRKTGFLNAAPAADFSPLTCLNESIEGKPFLALVDTGSTDTLISGDLVDELQLIWTKLQAATQVVLGNGKVMTIQYIVQDLKCKAGQLYFKTNAVIAPIAFDFILGQSFLTKERLMGGLRLPNVLDGEMDRSQSCLEEKVTRMRLKHEKQIGWKEEKKYVRHTTTSWRSCTECYQKKQKGW